MLLTLMSRKYFLSLLLLFSCFFSEPAFAQRGGGLNGERVHAIKVSYITDRIHLTSQQASRFWPVYDNYEADMRAMKQDFRRKHRGNSDGPEESRQFVEDDLDRQEQAIAIKRRYKDQFLRIISTQQLADLYVAEHEFRKLLLQQLKNRRGR